MAEIEKRQYAFEDAYIDEGLYVDFSKPKHWKAPSHRTGLMQTYDMRRPDRSDYADALNVTVRRMSIIERGRAAWWLLFQNWRA